MPLCARSLLNSLPCFAQHLPEDSGYLVEFALRGDQRGRDLDDRVATVVRPADEPLLVQPWRQEAAQKRLALVIVERCPRLLVLHELERVEVPRSAQVADDRKIEEMREGRAERVAVVANVLDHALALHDLDVLERDGALHGRAAERDP